MEKKYKKTVFDPLNELMAYYADKKAEKKEEKSRSEQTIEEILKQRIVDGDRIGIDNDLKDALKK